MSNASARYVLVRNDEHAHTERTDPVTIQRSRAVECPGAESAPVVDSKEVKIQIHPFQIPRALSRRSGKDNEGLISATLGLVSSGIWGTVSATATSYAGVMTPNGCTEFAGYATLYEEYRVVRISASLCTGPLHPAQAVGGTSVGTGTPLAIAWTRTPLPAVVTFSDIVDMTGHKLCRYAQTDYHTLSLRPKGCYADIGSGEYESCLGWQPTKIATKHAWGTFVFSTFGQAAKSGGIPYVIAYLFNVEFRRRRYTP